LKQTKEINIELALRNIESSMRFEGFDFSEETRVACREILESGERAGEVAEKLVSTRIQQYTRKGK
jgi:hypothetical protein